MGAFKCDRLSVDVALYSILDSSRLCMQVCVWASCRVESYIYEISCLFLYRVHLAGVDSFRLLLSLFISSLDPSRRISEKIEFIAASFVALSKCPNGRRDAFHVRHATVCRLLVLVYGCDDDAFWMTAEAFCMALHFMRALTHLFLNQPTLKTPKKRFFLVVVKQTPSVHF